MNFFNAQDAARRNTFRLVALFTIAVVGLIVLTNLVIAFAVVWMGGDESLVALPEDQWLWISIGVIGVVATASLYKYAVIRGGGRAVAESLGGALLPSSTQDLKQRRLLNVVEEMAIASGISVPPVYLLPEQSINAFAAGLDVDDAVIGVTQGTLELLNRDELQGVIGHEFSHILNGDTRINLRLIAILHGILFIGFIGYGLLRGGRFGGKNAAPMLAAAVGFILIGFAGTFCGNLIKAGVSRQREFLADAASVQFTRNPGGIAGALKKIGGSTSKMSHPKATEASHMFFGQAVSNFLGGMLATHPPLAKRIHAIEPNWDGAFPVIEGVEAPHPDLLSELTSQLSQSDWTSSDVVHVELQPEQVVEHVGRPSEANVELARALIESTDEMLKEAARDPWGARALVYAMLLDTDDEINKAQLSIIDENAERGVPQYVRRLIQPLDKSDQLHRLTLLELAIPALKELSQTQYQSFMTNLTALIEIDRRIDLFEWVLHRIVVKALASHFVGPRRARATLQDVDRAPDAARALINQLARLAGSVEAKLHAHAAGIEILGFDGLFEDTDLDINALNDSVRILRRLRPLAKPKLIKACAATVLADGQVNANEAALMQGIAAALDCPLPPAIVHAEGSG